MTNPNADPKSENNAQPPLPPPPGAGDFESQMAPPSSVGSGISSIIQRWKMQDLLKKISLATRGLGFVFSLLAFIIMASNKHGYWGNFDHYQEYRYVLAIAIISTLYTALQGIKQINELSTDRQMFPLRTSYMVDFIGDQIMAYLLISAASSAVPLTNNFRESGDNIFTDSSVAAISMEFFAFFSLAISSIVSGYKLSHETYI